MYVQNVEGETLKLPILFPGRKLYRSILLSVFSAKHRRPGLSGLFQDTPVSLFCLCRFLFRQPLNPNFFRVLIPYGAVIMLVFPTWAYIKVCAYALP